MGTCGPMTAPPTPTGFESLTSTMCPVLIRPPFAIECIKVSSRSIIRVFFPTLALEIEAVAYEGSRLGIKGLGGAGARGHFVKCDGAEVLVGDLIVSIVSWVCREPIEARSLPLVSSALRCFRFLSASSLIAFIRIDRLEFDSSVASESSEDTEDAVDSEELDDIL